MPSRIVRAMLGLCALTFIAAIATRFPPIARALPGVAAPWVVIAVGAALGVVGAIERRTPRGTVGPLWIQLGRPLSACMALGLSYFTTVFAQELGLSLGPVDPSFPGTVPASTATLWFFMFSIGFVGVGMMSAPALLVPLLRVVTRPLANAPKAVSLVGSAVLGMGFAVALLAGARAPVVVSLVQRGQAFFAANATVGTLVLVAIGVVPNLLPSKTEE